MRKMTGVRTIIKTLIMPAIFSEIESAFMVERVFVETYPKISIRKVIIPVAIPAP